MRVLNSPDVIIRADAEVGEGPVFEPRTGQLIWLDLARGVVFQNDLTTGVQSRIHVDTLVGAVAPRVLEHGFAAAVSDGFGLIVDGTLTMEDVVLPKKHHRMNDGKIDSRGRMWSGSTHTELKRGEGALHRWNGKEPSMIVARGFTLPNGLGWDADDSVMYLVDSLGHHLLSAEYRPEEGDVGEFRAIADIAAGLPDGLAVDVDGCIWVAIWGGGEIHRFDPHGKLVSVVPMPVSQPSSCAFGSDGTLYITTARSGLSDRELLEQPLAGSVFALATRTGGVPVPRFAA